MSRWWKEKRGKTEVDIQTDEHAINYIGSTSAELEVCIWVRGRIGGGRYKVRMEHYSYI